MVLYPVLGCHSGLSLSADVAKKSSFMLYSELASGLPCPIPSINVWCFSSFGRQVVPVAPYRGKPLARTHATLPG